MIIPAGYSLIAEPSDNAEPYQSFRIFFPIETGRNFMKANLKCEPDRSGKVPYSRFELDNYITSYVDQIRNLIGSGVQRGYTGSNGAICFGRLMPVISLQNMPVV